MFHSMLKLLDLSAFKFWILKIYTSRVEGQVSLCTCHNHWVLCERFVRTLSVSIYHCVWSGQPMWWWLAVLKMYGILWTLVTTPCKESQRKSFTYHALGPWGLDPLFGWLFLVTCTCDWSDFFHTWSFKATPFGKECTKCCCCQKLAINI